MLKDIFKKDINKDLQNQQERIERTEQEIKAVSKDVDKLEQAAAQKEMLLRQKNDELVKAKMELAEKIKSIDVTENRINELADELANAKFEKSKIEREITEANDKLRLKNSETDQVGYQIKKIKQEIYDAQKKIKKSEDQVDVNAQEAEQLKWDLKELENELEVQNLKLNTQKLMLSKTDKEVRIQKEDKKEKIKERDEIHNKIDAIEVMIAEKEKKITELQDTIRMTAIDIESKQRKLAELNEVRRETEIKLSDLEAQAAEGEATVRDLSDEIYKIQDEIKVQNEKFAQRSDEVSKIKTEVTAKESFLERQQKIVNINKTKLLDKLNEIGKLEEKIRKSEKSLATVQREVQLQNKLILTRKEKAKKQSAIFNALLTDISDKEDEKTSNINLLKDLQKKIEDTDIHIKEKQIELRDRKEKVAEQDQIIFEKNMEVDRGQERISVLNEEIDSQAKRVAHNKEILRATIIQISDNKSRVDELELKIIRNKQLLDKTAEKIKTTEMMNEGIKDTLSVLSTQNSGMENELRSLERRQQDLIGEKRELQRQEEQEKIKIVEKKKLIDDQEAYIKAAIKEIKGVEDELNEKTLEAKSLNKVIDNFKDEINRFDSEINHNRVRLKGLEKEIVSLVEEKTEYEITLHKNVEEIFNQSETSKTISDEVKAYLEEIKADARKRYALLKGTQEGIKRSNRLVEEKIKAASVLKDKIRKMQDDYSAGQRELARLNGQIKETKKVMSAHQDTLNDYHRQAEDMDATRSSLDAEISHNENHTMTLMHNIEIEKKRVAELEEAIIKGQKQIEYQSERVNELTKSLATLETKKTYSETANKKQIIQQESMETDIRKLENMVEGFNSKIEVQNQSMNKQTAYLKELTEKNKELTFKIAQLDELFDKNRVEITNNTAEIEKLEAALSSKEQEYEKKRNLAQRFDMMERSNFPELIEKMKETLEGHYFGLTVSYDMNEVKEVSRFTKNQINTIEVIQAQFVEMIESGLSLDAEIFSNIKIADRTMKATLSVIDLKGVDRKFVEDILTPFAQKVTLKFAGSKVSVRQLSEVEEGSNASKVGLEIKLPLHVAKPKTDEAAA